MEKENYNQIIFTAVRDNFHSGYSYTQKEVPQVSGTEIFILLTLYLGGILAVFSFASLLAGFLYMKRLKKYGYI